MKKTRIPDGAWEERGVIGTRIEIRKNALTVLWRGAPVLETKYSLVQEGESVLLAPEETGMRYTPDSEPYGTVTRLEWKDGDLLFEEEFPVSGKSSSLLSPTERSRYGDVTLVDREVLPRLQGTWTSTDGFQGFEIRKNEIKSGPRTERIHAARQNWDGAIRLIHEDPSRDGLLDYRDLRVLDDHTLSAMIPVCDAPSFDIFFHREKK